MQIAVIGTGNIGSTLARKWVDAGHDVVFGSRHPGSGSGAAAPSTDIGSALAGADVVLLAIPGAAVDDVASEHSAALRAPVVIDATNRMGSPALNARAALGPDVRYARAFSTLGWENFAEPEFGGLAADLFFSCAEGDRAVVEQLVAAVGLRPAYLGADTEDVVDRATSLWFALTKQHGTRHVALRVLLD